MMVVYGTKVMLGMVWGDVRVRIWMSGIRGVMALGDQRVLVRQNVNQSCVE